MARQDAIGECVMASMNVSLPGPLRDWVQSRSDTGAYASVSDYVRDLIRRDQVTTTDRETWLTSLDACIARGVADADGGRVHDLDEICDELDSRYASMAASRSTG
jgi:antitoxin ParD1/3/4